MPDRRAEANSDAFALLVNTAIECCLRWLLEALIYEPKAIGLRPRRSRPVRGDR